MALQQGSDAYSVIVLSDECDDGLECELPIDFSSPAATEVVIPLKSQLSLDGRLSNQSYIKMMVENAVAYSVDVDDTEKGKSDTRSNNEEALGNLKNEQVLNKSLQKQISFDMGGKYMQLLMNHSLMLSKFTTRDKIAGEKVVDAPRSRKYKRPASFNSRKVVLMFSVLSSLGTIILIYLTLRVRHMGDASIHSD
ncbi:hypothetical protein L1987_65462 [Smallanthus sonchifolius]|uniref:Uncharacterized protein n=1 Tax=Smallanthus sonchifolius TaxID=185202 RepID=A0ACB9BUL2_9ASTR|nr:hypothetical protein L1987_65462 [Smallanthus sonchifolius]